MTKLRSGAVVLLVLAFACPAAAREWTDSSGQYKIEADLVAVKNGKVYLEKADGATTAVELAKLSQADLDYLASLPEHKEYFASNPLPRAKPAAATGQSAAATGQSAAATGQSAAATGQSAAARPARAKPKMATIRVDDPKTVGEVRRWKEMGWGVTSLAFSPDGALLAVGKMDSAVMVFDVDKTTRTAFYDKLETLGQVTCCAFTPDGKRLLTGGYSGRIQIWEVNLGGTLTEGPRFVGHSNAIHTISISADGKTVVSGGAEKKVRCWDLETCRERFAQEAFKGPVTGSFISKSGKQALAGDGSTLALIDLLKGEIIQTMQLSSSYHDRPTISPDGQRVAVRDSGKIRMWDIRTGREYPPIQDGDYGDRLAFLPNGKYFLTGGRGKTNVWEVASQRKIYEIDLANNVFSPENLAVSPDNRHYAAIPNSAGQDLQVFRLPAEVAD